MGQNLLITLQTIALMASIAYSLKLLCMLLVSFIASLGEIYLNKKCRINIDMLPIIFVSLLWSIFYFLCKI